MIVLLVVAIIIGFGSAIALASTGSLVMIVLIPIAASGAVMLAGFLLAYRRTVLEAPASPSRSDAAMAAKDGDDPQSAWTASTSGSSPLLSIADGHERLRS